LTVSNTVDLVSVIKLFQSFINHGLYSPDVPGLR